MWNTNNGSVGPPRPMKDVPTGSRYRVVEQVAYAHPVREPQLFYAGQPTFHAVDNQASYGYPYYCYSGQAKVKRAANSDCMLHDPAETLVIDYADGAMSGSRQHRHPRLVTRPAAASPVTTSTDSQAPRAAPLAAAAASGAGANLTRPSNYYQATNGPISVSSDLLAKSEVTISSVAMQYKEDVYHHHHPHHHHHLPHPHHLHHHHHHQHLLQYQHPGLSQQGRTHGQLHPHSAQFAHPRPAPVSAAAGHDCVDGTVSLRDHHQHARFGVMSSEASKSPVPANSYRRPPVPRGSHSSDTSSAYSGSDTMQSIHSGCDNNDPIDLEGLHESVVDSDEDLADSMESMAIRDIVRDSLEKDPVDRTDDDIDILLEFTKNLEAFNQYTMAVRRALCSVMVFAVVEKAGTVVMNDQEELDSWSVIINGEVRIDPVAAADGSASKQFPRAKYLKCGDSFGITPTMEKLYHQGIMRTTLDDCQFVCITQADYYKILNEGESNRRMYEENGKIVLITELEAPGKSNSLFKVIRGTAAKLLSHLIDESSATDPTYVEDFLLTHRIFMPSKDVIQYLLQLMREGRLMDRVTRVLLLWVHNHFLDFELDPAMMEFLENFEDILEKEKMNGQLRMLNFACAEKARERTVILTRPSREERLYFTLMGGYERGFGIFIDSVEKGSKAADAGLKRGDQILDVNRHSFKHVMTLQKATTILLENTHLEMTVKSNLLGSSKLYQMREVVAVISPDSRGRIKKKSSSSLLKVHHRMIFKEMLHHPDRSPKDRPRKTSDLTGIKNVEYTVTSSGTKMRAAAEEMSSSGVSATSASGTVALVGRTLSGSRPASMSSKERMKSILSKLMMRPKFGLATSGIINAVDASDLGHMAFLGVTANDANDAGVWDVAYDSPDHSLKIFKSDQHFRYLLVHQNTSAREVVMLALQEFGITECSSNYTLCEVKVDGELVSQKRLPDAQTNLAERLGLGSRYYVKNIMSSDQLIPEDSIGDLVKESQVHILQLHAMETATQLMVEDFTTFRQIESTEYVENLFELNSKLGTPNLIRFGDLVNREMLWTITEIVSELNMTRRVKIIKQFIKIAQQSYKETQNFNSMFAILSGLDHVVVKRLKLTWEKVPIKYVRLKDEMLRLMDPSMNFRRYRNLISNCSPPLIPVYPMVCKDLTFIHLGNETYVDNLINFEKLRMLAREIRHLSNISSAPLDLFTMLERQGSDFSDAMRKMNPPTHMATMKRGMAGTYPSSTTGLRKGSRDAHNAKKMYEEAQMVRRVKAYLTKMPVVDNEDELMRMSMKCEPGSMTSSVNLTSAFSSAPSTSSQMTKSIKGAVSSPAVTSVTTVTATTATTTTAASKRPPSPSPSVASTTSSTSHISEGRKSTHSAAKFEARWPSSGSSKVATLPASASLLQVPADAEESMGYHSDHGNCHDVGSRMDMGDVRPSCYRHSFSTLTTCDRCPILRHISQIQAQDGATQHLDSDDPAEPEGGAQSGDDRSRTLTKQGFATFVAGQTDSSADLWASPTVDQVQLPLASQRLPSAACVARELRSRQKPRHPSMGTDSPQAVRKLMALSEPTKTRRHQPKVSPSASPKATRRPTKGHERCSSDSVAVPSVSLSAESSSVATLTTLAAKTGGHYHDDSAAACSSAKSRSLPRPQSDQRHTKQQQQQQHKASRTRIARTLSRDQAEESGS